MFLPLPSVQWLIFPCGAKWGGLCLEQVAASVWVLQEEVPFGLSSALGKERIHLCLWVCFLDVWSHCCQLLNADGKGGSALFTLLMQRLKYSSSAHILYTCSKREQETRLDNLESMLRLKSCKKTNCKQFRFCGDSVWGVFSSFFNEETPDLTWLLGCIKTHPLREVLGESR